MHKLIEITQALNSKPYQEVYFHLPVKPKLPFGSFLIYAAKVVKSEAIPSNNGIWLMDGEGEWHGPLRESEMNAEFIIHALYNRLVQPTVPCQNLN